MKVLSCRYSELLEKKRLIFGRMSLVHTDATPPFLDSLFAAGEMDVERGWSEKESDGGPVERKAVQ